MKNRYFRKSKRPRPPEFVKLEVWLPHLSHAKLLRRGLDQDIPADRLAALTLLRAIKDKDNDHMRLPQLIQTSEGSESYPIEQQLIYSWLKGMGPYGFELDELMSLCMDMDMSNLAMSYAINGLMDKKLIERKDNTLYVTKKQQTQRLFKAVKGKRVIKRKLKTKTIFKKETK